MTTTEPTTIPPPTELIRKAHTLAQRVHEAPMATRDDAANMSDAKKSIRSLTKRIEEDREQLTRPLMDTIAAIKAKYEPGLTELKAAQRECDSRLLAYAQEQERIAAAAREEEARRFREAEAARQQLEQQAAEAAAKLSDAGDQETAEAVIEEALAVPEPVMARVMAAGPARGDFSVSSIRRYWTFELLDARLLPREYLIPDERAINGAIREGVREIPGVRIYQRESITTR